MIADSRPLPTTHRHLGISRSRRSERVSMGRGWLRNNSHKVGRGRMNDRYVEFRNATESALLRGAGATSPLLRQAVAAGQAPAPLVTLVEKIRSRAWSVTDEDIDALRDLYTEEQLFEIIVSAAFGASDERLQAALGELEEA